MKASAMPPAVCHAYHKTFFTPMKTVGIYHAEKGFVAKNVF